MPYKPKIIERLPEWIGELSNGDDCLEEVLTEAWVAGEHARNAIRQRGSAAPRACASEMEAADGILEAIREGRVPSGRLAAKAAQAVRKFSTARECARVLERNDSPRFAQERPHRIRLLGAREDSVLARRVRNGAR